MINEFFTDLCGPWPEACFLLTREGKIKAANIAGAAMLGLSYQEVTEHSLSEFVRQSPATLSDYLATCAKNSQQISSTLTLLNSNGQVTHYSCQGHQIMAKAEEQSLIFLRCAKVDQTNKPLVERKETEEEISHAREQSKAILALALRPWISRDDLVDFALAEAVRLTDSTVGYLHFINEDQQTLDLFSWSAKVRTDCEASKSVHYPLEKAGIWADCVRLRQPVIHNDYPHTPNRKGYPQGHFPVLRHLSVPVFDEDRIVAILGVGNKEQPYDLRDANKLISYMEIVWSMLQQKLAEIEVRNIKEQWEKTFDAMDDIVTIHDPEMRIIRANKAAGILLGVAPEELIGRYCYEVFRDGNEPCDGCPEFLAHSDLNQHRATICHANLGKTFIVTSFPIIDEVGLIISFVHTARDISEQVHMEERLRQSQKMEAIGTLAGGIAHDFNNILVPILGYTEMAINKLVPDNSITDDLKQVIKAAMRAKDMVAQILAFSRQSAQERKPMQPNLVIKEALKLLKASLPSTIEIRTNIAAECGTILADPTQMHQLLMNLCTNAYQAMREAGGTLGIDLKKTTITVKDNKVAGLELTPGDYMLLEVSDTGGGMDEATMARIFDPYFTTKDIGKGTGLGLSVVHGIVKSYQGQITVQSEPGRGTKFHVYLPIITETPNLQIWAVSNVIIPTGTEQLLVVDDEPVITEMLETVLQNLGYQVTASNNSLEALVLIEHDPAAFDLLITDMTMPNLTGFELAQKTLTLNPVLPIILCTGFSEIVNQEQAKAIGIQVYLTKPLSVRELTQTVRKVLDEKNART